MSKDAVPSCRAAAEHSVACPAGTIYYRTEGSGPPLVLIGGGPSNADTLARSPATSPPAARSSPTTAAATPGAGSMIPRSRPPSPLHADDVRHVLDDLGAGPASVFATSVGALIGLELAAAIPTPSRG
jgi:pimeloyl-ACP methyl ester carboxylesterase